LIGFLEIKTILSLKISKIILVVGFKRRSNIANGGTIANINMLINRIIPKKSKLK
jgi:hypothetical protein